MASLGIESDVVELTKWGCRWVSYGLDYLLNGGEVHQVAVKLLDALEKEPNAPEHYLETHEVVHRKTVTKVTDTDIGTDVVKDVVFDNVKVTKRIVKRGRSKFAMSLAKQAYLKFGKREITPANELVTRKWMVKYLEGKEFADMRVADKVLAIDRAIFLSFVPTMVYNDMKVVMADKASKNMISGVTTSFGRIFSVRRRAAE